ncbi:uncharacterized protein BXIN_0310 [Babesia sp. Xinjiang]|uniref:uncharacterized protein n=1 Tax=Babesia sp. Xinjiang TaxID=462227 RepID=UPI000A23D153|nr:uncharacterized protein BXIN_0297 [Babesia sp. Xinjiang]XP_028871610.1 uncharacterized protein BXIN_0310 [Babesia sp. Xinjiang]ORM41106.1 hypothetical protein BXIN_0297 [Babesia sp. Xinjiang]ORM41154.1 hypothetical protein BXIN_0310 [Babesia sp. Xinjiang]
MRGALTQALEVLIVKHVLPHGSQLAIDNESIYGNNTVVTEMRQTLFCFIVLINTITKELANASGYRSWYGPAKNAFNRGKSAYENIVKAAHDREEECVILHSNDSQVAQVQGNEWGSDLGSEQFPCLQKLQRNESKALFDINANIQGIVGESRKRKIIAEGGCWQFVLNQINSLDIDRCDIKGEVSRALIALAKTKCHFIRSGRAFPLAEHGCILNPQTIDDSALGIFTEDYETNPCKERYEGEECQKLKEDIVAQCTNLRIMSESAFQMYHADLNHIDDICFYLQANEWNRRTESNINRLGESTVNLLNKHQNLEMFLDLMQNQQEKSLQQAARLSSWMGTLQGDMKNVFVILDIIRSYQRKIVALVIACATDFLSYKVITRSAILDQFALSKDVIYSTTSKAIKLLSTTNPGDAERDDPNS